MSDEIFAKNQISHGAPSPLIILPIVNPILHPSGHWTPGNYRRLLVEKARAALAKVAQS